MNNFDQMNLNQIKAYVDAHPEELMQLIRALDGDSRKSVRTYRKSLISRLAENERLSRMKETEASYHLQGYRYIACLDEVGRGPLFGPVVSAAVIMKAESVITGVNDSKKLSSQKRETLYEQIVDDCVCFAVGIVDNVGIDEVNILNATKRSMLEALSALSVKPDFIITDSVELNTDIPLLALVKADEKIYGVSCASIIAKVIRDEMMGAFALEYPAYGFDTNMGYGTQKHIDAIRIYGPTIHHRFSFLSHFLPYSEEVIFLSQFLRKRGLTPCDIIQSYDKKSFCMVCFDHLHESYCSYVTGFDDYDLNGYSDMSTQFVTIDLEQSRVYIKKSTEISQ
jgi:ribonuclease HII